MIIWGGKSEVAHGRVHQARAIRLSSINPKENSGETKVPDDKKVSGTNGTAVILVTFARRARIGRTREGMCIVSGVR